MLLAEAALSPPGPSALRSSLVCWGCPGDTTYRSMAGSGCMLGEGRGLAPYGLAQIWVMWEDIFRACIASIALLLNRGVGDNERWALHPTSHFSRQLFTCLEAM